jgi:hypothetical protein
MVMPIRTYEIGELYNPKVTKWPELPEYNYRGGQHELLLFFRNPTDAEIAAVQKGGAEFAFAIEKSVIFFLYRFEPIPWGDAAFTVHLVPDADRRIPEAEPTAQSRAILRILLVDAATGILKAMRVVSFSPDFTRQLHKAIRQQAATPFEGEETHRTGVKEVYARFDTSSLLNRAAARCKGGLP